MTDKLLILRAFNTLNQVRNAKVPKLNLLPSFHELVEDLRARLAQPEPEPVAWVYDKFNWESWGDGSWQITVTQNKERDDQQPLYTAPLQREWQGLTDEEIMSLLPGAVRLPPGWSETVRAIEAKLKEKNT
jgi:hypothetical protein